MANKWAKREDDIMKSLGLRPQPGSGGFIWTLKEDGESDEIIAQLKSTDGKVVGVARQDVKDLIYHAHVAHKLPLFVIDFVNGTLLLAMRPFDVAAIADAIKDAPIVKGDKKR